MPLESIGSMQVGLSIIKIKAIVKEYPDTDLTFVSLNWTEFKKGWKTY